MFSEEVLRQQAARRITPKFISVESQRILHHVPRKLTIFSPDPVEMTHLLRSKYNNGERILWSQQAAIIKEAADNKGALCFVPPGGGKTDPICLLPTVFNARRAMIFTKGDLKKDMIAFINKWGRYWNYWVDQNGPNPMPLAATPFEGVWGNPNTRIIYYFQNSRPTFITRNPHALMSIGHDWIVSWVPYDYYTHITPAGMEPRPGFLPDGRLSVYSYDDVSTSNKWTGKPKLDLEANPPDLLLFDEIHCLANPTATRTIRFIRLLERFKHIPVIGLSGTLTKDSLEQFDHFLDWTHRERKPTPIFLPERQSWMAIIDAGRKADPQQKDFAIFEPVRETFNLTEDYAAVGLSEQDLKMGPNCWEAGERVTLCRKAFRRHLATTSGIVMSDSDCNIPLVMERLAIRQNIPMEIRHALYHLNNEWVLPDGELIADAPIKARCARFIAAGFYYVPDWPNGIVDQEWVDAKSAYFKEIREILKQGVRGADSPMLIARHCKLALGLPIGNEKKEYSNRAVYNEEYLEEEDEEEAEDTAPIDTKVFTPSRDLLYAFKAWHAVHLRPPPPVKTLWISDFLIRDIEEKLNTAYAGIPVVVWYQHKAIEEALMSIKVNGRHLQVFGRGKRAPASPVSCGLSIRIHGTGKNLQDRWSEGLVAEIPPNGTTWEQLLARFHRPGQLKDVVRFSYYAHLPPYYEAMEAALDHARYQNEISGPQRLLKAKWV